mgnify:CR=1 FL=1
MPSIFELERRNDLQKSFYNFYEDLQEIVTTSTDEKCPMQKYLDRCIRYWPHRCGATGIEDYLNQIGGNFYQPKDDRDLLLILELVINLLHWAPKQEEMDIANREPFVVFTQGKVRNEVGRLLANAEYILEQCCNMTIREEKDKKFPKYYITKRNAHVDAAVVAVPKLADSLLGYLDVRNQDDLDYKKAVLTEIHRHLEPLRKDYKESICSSISEEFFVGMNTFGIRHNTASQRKLRKDQKKKVYDKLFFMAVYVLQTPAVSEYKTELKTLREKA